MQGILGDKLFSFVELEVGTYYSKAVDIRFGRKFALSDILFWHVPQMFTATAGHADGGALML